MVPSPIIVAPPAFPPASSSSRSAEGTKSYTISTSSDLDGKLLWVKDKERILWSKTRELVDDEIVDTILDSNSVPTWTIHRPLQGWYLAIQRVESNEEASEEPIALESSKRQQDPRHLSFVLDAPPQDEGKAKDEGGPVPPSPNVRLNFNQSGDEAILAAPSSSTLSTTPIATRSLLATALANSKDTKRKFTLQPHLSKEDQGKLDAGFLGWKKAFGVGVVCGSHYSCRWEEGDVEIFNFQDTSGTLSTAIQGTLTVQENALGFDTGFWIAVSFAYQNFLIDSQAYLAASDG